MAALVYSADLKSYLSLRLSNANFQSWKILEGTINSRSQTALLVLSSRVVNSSLIDSCNLPAGSTARLFLNLNLRLKEYKRADGTKIRNGFFPRSLTMICTKLHQLFEEKAQNILISCSNIKLTNQTLTKYDLTRTKQKYNNNKIY